MVRARSGDPQAPARSRNSWRRRSPPRLARQSAHRSREDPPPRLRGARSLVGQADPPLGSKKSADPSAATAANLSAAGSATLAKGVASQLRPPPHPAPASSRSTSLA